MTKHCPVAAVSVGGRQEGFSREAQRALPPLGDSAGRRHLHLPSDSADDDWLCVDVETLVLKGQKTATGKGGAGKGAAGGKWRRGTGFGAHVVPRKGRELLATRRAHVAQEAHGTDEKGTGTQRPPEPL